MTEIETRMERLEKAQNLLSEKQLFRHVDSNNNSVTKLKVEVQKQADIIIDRNRYHRGQRPVPTDKALSIKNSETNRQRALSGPLFGDELNPVLNKEFVQEVQDKVINHIESLVGNMQEEDKLLKYSAMNEILKTTRSDLTRSLLDKGLKSDINQDLRSFNNRSPKRAKKANQYS